MPDEIIFLQHLGLAILMGGLIGIERERNHKMGAHHEFGGIRTMALVAMLGFLIFRLFGDNTLVFSVLTGGYLALLVSSYIVSSVQNRNSGATTEVAAFMAFLVGLLTGMDQELYAITTTLVLVLILYFKSTLHNFARHLDKEELYDIFKFIAVAFIILPLLPNQTYGPLDVLNPYEIWLIVVLISSISFVSYIAIKWLGPKDGIGLSGFLGGLISSTAVAMSFSGLSKKAKSIINPFVFGILIASSAMFVRVFFTLSILNNHLASLLLYPLLAMALTGLTLSFLFWFNRKEKDVARFSEKSLELHSPFSLKSALKFGVLCGAMIFISKFASDYWGSYGTYATAFFSGLFDVDAMTVSLANLSKDGQMSSLVAGMGVLIATITNTLSKGAIVLFFASRPVGIRVACSLGVVVTVGFSVFYLTNY